MSLFGGFLIITCAGVLGLLAGEALGYPVLRAVCKMLASTGFVAAALAAGAFESRYGQCLLAALVFSWWGDLFLLGSHERFFQAGLASFLTAHLAYSAAFSVHGLDVGSSAELAVVFVPMAGFVAWRLNPFVPRPLRPAVLGYIAVITGMVILAGGTWHHPGGRTISLGAVLFYVSDLAVARDRFVSPGMANRWWGLPAYYGAQLLLAHSAALL